MCYTKFMKKPSETETVGLSRTSETGLQRIQAWAEDPRAGAPATWLVVPQEF